MANVMQNARFVGGYATATAGTVQTQAGATALTGGINFVTTGNANDGVKLPSNYALGDMVMVCNSSGVTLRVYPGTDGKINNGSANVYKDLAANMTGLYISLGSNNWAAVLSA